MKAYYLLAAAMTFGLLCGCSNDDDVLMEDVKEIKATLNEFKLEESLTRTAYNISEQSGFQTLWAAGDVLGIYPIGGDQVSFPISDGVGTTTAKFDGGSWALRGTYKYAAYYPFSTECYTIDQKAIPVNLVGQVQTGNNTTSHLAAYDFMAAAATQPSSNGSVDLAFNHVGCFLRMQLTLPVAGTFTQVDIETNSGAFTTKGTVNLAATVPALTATETSSKLCLGLNNVKTTGANQSIVLYMMVAPDNLSSKTLTFTVTDNAGKTYTKTAAGKNMIATYAYNYALTLESTGTGGSTGGGGWGEEDEDPYNGHEYVDLGVVVDGKPVYWATTNIGAEDPADSGLFFAWGETIGYTENPSDGRLFDWASYSSYLCGGTVDTMKKYCTNSKYGIVDNKTVLEPGDDAAHVNWQGAWRMPTKEELDSLLSQCKLEESLMYSYAKKTNVRGLKVSNRIDSNKFIFFPLIGRYTLYGFDYVGITTECWSSSLDESSPYEAYILEIIIGQYDRFYSRSSGFRCYGRSVRPVCQ